MHKQLTLICLSLAVSTVFSAVDIIPKEDPPAKFAGQPGCYNKELDVMLPLNVAVPATNGQCLQYLCRDNGETLLESCGVISAPECTIIEDRSLPYPDCCPKAQCNNPPSEEIPQESEEVSQESEEVSQESEEVSQESEEVSQESEEVSQESEEVSQESDDDDYLI